MIWMTWATALLGCAKPCEYVARCDGTVLETCYLGVDQLFGSGESATDCADTPNPVCVELETDVAFCARTEQPTCEPEATSCDADLAVTCNEHGFEVAEDCNSGFGFGPTCVVSPEDEAVCGIDPVSPCDFDTYEQTCEGEQVRMCRNGVELLFTCSEDRACGVVDGEAGCRERE